jgi:hypothetical protein
MVVMLPTFCRTPHSAMRASQRWSYRRDWDHSASVRSGFLSTRYAASSAALPLPTFLHGGPGDPAGQYAGEDISSPVPLFVGWPHGGWSGHRTPNLVP